MVNIVDVHGYWNTSDEGLHPDRSNHEVPIVTRNDDYCPKRTEHGFL
jgi:hypothetical protein